MRWSPGTSRAAEAVLSSRFIQSPSPLAYANSFPLGDMARYGCTLGVSFVAAGSIRSNLRSTLPVSGNVRDEFLWRNIAHTNPTRHTDATAHGKSRANPNRDIAGSPMPPFETTVEAVPTFSSANARSLAD